MHGETWSLRRSCPKTKRPVSETRPRSPGIAKRKPQMGLLSPKHIKGEKKSRRVVPQVTDIPRPNHPAVGYAHLDI